MRKLPGKSQTKNKSALAILPAKADVKVLLYLNQGPVTSHALPSMLLPDLR